MKPSNPSKEQQLLIEFLKGNAPDSLHGIDKGILFDLFRRHRLFTIATAILPLLTKEERERWKVAIQSRTLRSMHQLAVCHKLMRMFEKEGVEAITFKGPLLAHLLFGNVGDRHSSDLDILVQKNDIRKVIRLTESEGFELKYPDKGLSERQWNHYLRYKKDIGLYSREQNLFVELHHGFENYLGLKASHMQKFTEDLEKVRIGGYSFLSMSKHYTFLYLVMHGGVHQFRRLFWLRDVAEALVSWKLDHRKILADAKEMGLDRLLGASLLLVRELCDKWIPEEYTPYLLENQKLLARLRVIALDFILGPEFPDKKGKIEHHLFMLRLKPEIAHYFRTFREIINRQYIGKFRGGH